MKALRLTRDALAPGRVEGRVLAHDVRDAAGRVAHAKGAVLGAGDADRLALLPWGELHLLELEADDVPEESAGRRLAHAVCGDGLVAGAEGAGHWPLRATARGIVAIDTDALHAINADEAFCVYTLYDGQVVDANESVGHAKIIPFAVQGAAIDRVEHLSRGSGGIVCVRPFRALRVAAVVQETLGDRAMRRFRETLAEKLAWLGATMIEPRLVPAEEEAVTRALQAAEADGAQVIALAGTRSMDPLDPGFAAVANLGGRMVRHGVPAHPGSLCWIARTGRSTIVGMPSCGLFSRATVFDLLLPRLLVGEMPDAAQLSRLGHGGFLTRDMAYRFPPYRREVARGATEPTDEPAIQRGDPGALPPSAQPG